VGLSPIPCRVGGCGQYITLVRPLVDKARYRMWTPAELLSKGVLSTIYDDHQLRALLSATQTQSVYYSLTKRHSKQAAHELFEGKKKEITKPRSLKDMPVCTVGRRRGFKRPARCPNRIATCGASQASPLVSLWSVRPFPSQPPFGLHVCSCPEPWLMDDCS